MTLMLDTTLNEQLIKEGLAREIINKVNTMRRDAKLEVTDRIYIKMETSPKVIESFKEHETYISSEILALKFEFTNCPLGTTWELNGENAKIEISRI